METELMEKRFDVETFRELTSKVISKEKAGFWSDWTKEQQEIYRSGDWKAFSVSRGYSEEEIADMANWISMMEEGEKRGLAPLDAIRDITGEAALKNLKMDAKGEILLSSHIPSSKKIREGIMEVESRIGKLPGAMFGDCFPLKHTFADGAYVREMSVPKGFLIVTKIHKVCHPYFLLKGNVSVLTEDGIKRIQAPYSGITPAGTKRICYTHEDTVWTTVHVTNETDLKKIEDDIIAKTYDDLLPFEESELSKKNCLILALKEKGRDFSSLLVLKSQGLYLPFKQSLEKLKESSISLDGLFVQNKGMGTWHVTADQGMPLDKFDAIDTDLVGSWAGVAIGGAGVAGSLISTFGGHGSVDQRPMITDAQAGAQNAMLQFGRSGQTPWGYDFTQGYGGSLGNYNMTGLENQGQGALSSTLSMGNPFIFNQGTQAVNDLLSTHNYDPNNDQGVYKGLTSGIDFNRDEAIKQTNQGAAYQGNLYSSNAARNIGNINVQAANQKSNILSQLYQNFTNQKIGAASTAINAGTQDQSMNLARIGASQQYGQLARTLQDQQAKDAYAAWQTQRQTELAPMSALSSLSGQNANYGVQSVNQPNPWNSLLNTLTMTGGYLYGQNSTNSTGGGAIPSTATPAPVAGPAQGPWQNWGQYPANPYTMGGR